MIFTNCNPKCGHHNSSIIISKILGLCQISVVSSDCRLYPKSMLHDLEKVIHTLLSCWLDCNSLQVVIVTAATWLTCCFSTSLWHQKVRPHFSHASLKFRSLRSSDLNLLAVSQFRLNLKGDQSFAVLAAGKTAEWNQIISDL